MIKEQPALTQVSALPRSGAEQVATSPYRLEQVTRRYGEHLVLDIPALEVRSGEVLALVGPSGAGKSTLLRLLNFLEPPSTGTIWFQDTPVRPVGTVPLELRRQVTTVFQRPMLLSTTVLKNVAYGLQLRKAAQARSIACAALEQVGLGHLADKPASILSGGEMQRVALARAIVLKPRVLLLDEPTANLDPYNVQLIEQIITTLHQQNTTSIVLVTHNIFQARRLAQRVALMLAGKIVEIADAATFFEAPSDARTAAFVRGEMVY
jgi:tungstate transport system ATP-binding protein